MLMGLRAKWLGVWHSALAPEVILTKHRVLNNIRANFWLNWERFFAFLEPPLKSIWLELLKRDLFVLEQFLANEWFEVLGRILLFLRQPCWLHSLEQILRRLVFFSKLFRWYNWWVFPFVYFPQRNELSWLLLICFWSLFNLVSFLFLDLFFLVSATKQSSEYVPLALSNKRSDESMILLRDNKSSLRISNNVIHF